MISFIIIGRNEGWKLTKCFTSVFETIRKNQFASYEVIYVDSKSTDDSIERAMTYPDVKIILLTNDYNSAIARNIGAKESRGEILFFIDGDMELIPEFMPLVINEKSELNYNFVSGQFVNYYYINDLFIYSHPYHRFKIQKDRIDVVTGGLFIIKRELWMSVGGMNEKFKRSQDIDFGLRLAKKGYKLIRKQEILAIHHTIEYRDNKRMWELLFDKSELYGRSLLYREHILNPFIYKVILRNDYTLVVLIISVVLSYLFWSFLPMPLYLMIICIRALYISRKNLGKSGRQFIYFIVRDITVSAGFFLFFPKRKFDIQFKTVPGK